MPGLSLVAKGVEDAKVQSAVSMSLRARVLVGNILLTRSDRLK